MMMKGINNHNGFTLIEVIVTLILVGILAVIGSMGLVNMLQGYVTSKENTAAVQKGQIAFLQMSKLLTYASSINSGSSSSINFNTYISGSPTTSTSCMFTFNNATGVITFINNQGAGDTLVAGVKQFKLGYYNSYNSTEQSAWTSGSSKVIELTMTLNLGQGQVSPEFKTRIIPRNVIYQ
jgi:prepilin-type N-terminal cleavage/methylation domain-containing protein